MRHLHYLKIKNFKRFGEEQRIELEHPSVIIGPNNCGKTSVIQALALWSQAIQTWFDIRKEGNAKERSGIPLNRLAIVAVPVQRTRFFWHGTQVRDGNKDIPIIISVGVSDKNGSIRELAIRFRNQGDELVYCVPDGDYEIDFIANVAKLHVELLYSMSGLDTEEPILQPGRVNVLLGQGRTAEVLRNLCLTVFNSSDKDWKRIVTLMNRLFKVQLQNPMPTQRGTIALFYRQDGVTENLDISSAGRGFLQMLLIFAYLYSHQNSVLLIDEPDAHLEILRQKQIYTLLRDIAHENNSQVVIVTHSEVILDEALDNNLTLLLEGKADNLAKKQDIRNSLKNFGADHYVKARECGHVFYVEGSTDIDMLHALARHLKHPVAEMLDKCRLNSYYVCNNHHSQNTEAELERLEGGFQATPHNHFNSLRGLLPDLRGLAILDSDGKNRKNKEDEKLKILYWKRYELENYFITPDVLRTYFKTQQQETDLFETQEVVEKTLAEIILEEIFDNEQKNYETWVNSPPNARLLIWETKTENKGISKLTETFFRNLATTSGAKPLLQKGEFYRLVEHANLTETAKEEVKSKLDALRELLQDSPNSL